MRNMHVYCGSSNIDRRLPPFDDEHIEELDRIMLDEHWDPEAIFSEWALQIGNALHQEEAIPLKPWI